MPSRTMLVSRFRQGCRTGALLILSSSLAGSFAVAASIDDLQHSLDSPVLLKNLSLEELSQIEVITPSKEPVPAFRTPMALSVVTGDQIRRSGATSIPEALRLVPGVEVSRINASRWAIGIRGFGDRFSRGVLVLIDGRTVYTTLLAGTYWDVQDTMMEDIDRIEVIRGPGGTIWGPNAVNGVINIITKSTKDTEGMLVTAGGGNEEQGFASFRYGGGNGKDFHYRIYGKGFTRSPEHHLDNRNYDDWRSSQAGFRMDWKTSDRSSFTLQGDMYKEGAGEIAGATFFTPPYSRVLSATADLGGGNIMGRWDKKISDSDDIHVQAYYDRTNRDEANFADLRNTFDVDFMQHLRLPGRNELSWGAGFRATLINDQEVVPSLAFRPNERTDQLITGFVQDEIGLIENRLALTIGTKILHTNFTGAGLEPSARLAWTPTDKQTFWVSFTHALRTPSDAEENFYLTGPAGLAADGSQRYARFNPNSYFAPEQLNAYEAGYRRLFTRNLYLGFAGFYNHHHNLIDQELTGSFYLEDTPAPPHLLLPAQFGNGLLGTTKGGEIVPDWKIASYWQLKGAYSYLQMDIRPAPGSPNVGSVLATNGSSPRHSALIQSSFDITKKLSFDAYWRYMSALPGQGVPSYSTADARLGWRFHDQLELSFVGRNLLQPSHPEFGGDPGPLVGIKRSVYAKLTWTR